MQIPVTFSATTFNAQDVQNIDLQVHESMLCFEELCKP